MEHLEIYQPGEAHDLAMLQWWMAMAQAGEVEQTLTGNGRSLSAFFAYLQPPHIVTFLRSDDSLVPQMVFILEPVLRGAFVMLWVAPERRQSPHALDAVLRAYRAAFETFPVLLGVTRQAALLPGHARLGYTVLGRVPKVWDGTQDGWVVTVTSEDFEAALSQPRKRA